MDYCNVGVIIVPKAAHVYEAATCLLRIFCIWPFFSKDKVFKSLIALSLMNLFYLTSARFSGRIVTEKYPDVSISSVLRYYAMPCGSYYFFPKCDSEFHCSLPILVI